jgi:hypothetical protein
MTALAGVSVAPLSLPVLTGGGPAWPPQPEPPQPAARVRACCVGCAALAPVRGPRPHEESSRQAGSQEAPRWPSTCRASSTHCTSTARIGTPATTPAGSTAPPFSSRGWGRTATGWALGSCRWSARPDRLPAGPHLGRGPASRARPQAPRRGVATLPHLPPAAASPWPLTGPAGEGFRSAPSPTVVASRPAGGPTGRDAAARLPSPPAASRVWLPDGGSWPPPARRQAAVCPAWWSGAGTGLACGAAPGDPEPRTRTGRLPAGRAATWPPPASRALRYSLRSVPRVPSGWPAAPLDPVVVQAARRDPVARGGRGPEPDQGHHPNPPERRTSCGAAAA